MLKKSGTHNFFWAVIRSSSSWQHHIDIHISEGVIKCKSSIWKASSCLLLIDFYSKIFTSLLEGWRLLWLKDVSTMTWSPRGHDQYFYHSLHMLRQKKNKRHAAEGGNYEILARFLNIYEAEFTVTETTCSWEWGLDGTKSLKGSAAHIWVGTDPQHPGAVERKGKKKVGCPVRPQPSQVGWNFCPHQLFTNHLR